MAKDISEELYAKIKESFDRKYEKAQLLGEPLHDVFARIQSGAATFRDADMYAVEVGSMLSDSLKEHIKLDKLPNKTFYRNIAQKTLGVSLKDGYGMVSNIAAVIQEEMNEAAGIGLKGVKPKLEVKAVDKVVEGAVQAKSQEELDAALTEPVKTFTRRVVDDTQKANARLHNKVGLEVKVDREYDGVGLHEGTDVCDWCLQRAGTWTYEKAMANGVFERHEGCGCIIDYTSKKGERTRGTGWKNSEGKTTKTWKWEETQNIKAKNPKALEENILEKTKYEKPINIGHDLGAKTVDTLVRLPDGSQTRVTPGSKIDQVQTIAGCGRKRQIDEIDTLMTLFPDSNELLWKKKKGIGFVDYDGDSYKAELHWYEEPSQGRVRMKVKPDAAGNWFIDD